MRRTTVWGLIPATERFESNAKILSHAQKAADRFDAKIDCCCPYRRRRGETEERPAIPVLFGAIRGL